MHFSDNLGGDFWFFAMLNISFALSLDSIDYSTFPVHTYILTPNNDCEASIRPFATGRKVWLFADSPAGARASSIVYTLVETAKLNHLDVFGYLCYLLESLPDLDHRNHPELLEAYLLWSETLPESCRLREHRINKKCMF